MKKLISLFLCLCLAAGLAPAAAESADAARTVGAKWIDSGLYGTFAGMGEIRPQDDFAACVNREWAENAQIPEGEGLTSARTELERANNDLKIQLLTGEKKDDPELTSMQNFFAMLIDWDTRNVTGYQELKTYADDIMSISSIGELTAFFSDPERNLYGYPMIDSIVMADAEDAMTHIMNFCNPAMFGSTDPSLYTEGNDGPMLAYVRQLSEYMMKRLGYSEAEAEEIFSRCFALEKNFAPAAAEYQQRRALEGDAAQLNPTTVEELEKKMKNLPLMDIYRSLGFELSGKINLWMPGTFDVYDSLYTEEHLEELKAWVLVWTLIKTSDFVDRETSETAVKVSAPLTGTEDMLPDERYAYKAIYELIPGMIDKLYAEYCFDQEVKPQVTELTKMMIDAYRVMLQEEDWLSEETKAAAIEKLDSIKLHICYPDAMPDFTDVKIPSKEEGGTLLKAYKSINRSKMNSEIHRLEVKNDGVLWNVQIKYSELGAAYMPSENSININAGICGGDYYDASWPLEKKLGGLCMVIGHEITHAFDSEGANYDKIGNYRDWWKAEDRQAFQERVDKLLAYYSKLVPVPQLTDKAYGEAGARFIQGEAIADLGSLKCLLSIAKQQKDFDYEMFFTQLATIQKAAKTDAAEMQYLRTDNHPVECYRCNIPVQNFDEFLETYGVREGDGMYLAPEDRIRVW